MAYTLKATGVAAIATSIIAVDQDGTTIRDFKSSTRTANMTVDANVSRGTSTWKSVSRGYFETKSNGGFDFYGITIAPGHEIPWDNSYEQPGTGTFIAYAGTAASAGAHGILTSSGGELLLRRSGKLAISYSGSDGLTTLPTDGTTKFSVGVNFVYGADRDFYYGPESGSLAIDGDFTDGGFGGNNLINAIGGLAGQGNAPGKFHVIVIAPRPLTLTEYQSLHDDWFGTLFDVSTTTTINCTVGNAAANGSTANIARNVTIICVAGNAVADGSVATVTNTATGSFATKPLKNNTRTVLASETGVTLNIYNATTGVLVVQKTGVTTNASGIAVVSDPLIVAGTTYAYEPVMTGGRRRLPLALAA